MKTIFNFALLVLLGSSSTALAAGGAQSEGLSWLVILFLVFGGLIIAFQMVPGLVLFVSMVRGLFRPSAQKKVAAVKEPSKS